QAFMERCSRISNVKSIHSQDRVIVNVTLLMLNWMGLPRGLRYKCKDYSDIVEKTLKKFSTKEFNQYLAHVNKDIESLIIPSFEILHRYFSNKESNVRFMEEAVNALVIFASYLNEHFEMIFQWMNGKESLMDSELDEIVTGLLKNCRTVIVLS